MSGTTSSSTPQASNVGISINNNNSAASRVLLPSNNAWARPLQHSTTPTTTTVSSSSVTTTTARTRVVASTNNKKTTSSTVSMVTTADNEDGSYKSEAASSSTDPNTTLLRERFLHLISSLLGQRVILTKNNGTQVEGILHTFTPFGDDSSSSLVPEQRNLYVLKSAKLLTAVEDANNNSNGTDIFPEGSTVLVPASKVHNVRKHSTSLLLTPTNATRNSANSKKDVRDNSTTTTATKQQFLTDTDISSSKTFLSATNKNLPSEKILVAAGSAWTSGGSTVSVANAQLETKRTTNISTSTTTAATNTASSLSALPWRPQRSITPTSSLGGYASAVKANSKANNAANAASNDALSGTIGGWDQFQANEKLFNVKASFDENQYTTTLDKSAIPTHLLEKAERMAREIEGQTSDNIHIMEERGVAIASEELDEEDKYSGVRRIATAATATLSSTPQDKPEPNPSIPQSRAEESGIKKIKDSMETTKESVRGGEDSTSNLNSASTKVLPVDEMGIISTAATATATSGKQPITQAAAPQDGEEVINVSNDSPTNSFSAASDSKEQQQSPQPPVTSKLNPTAKEFTFNPSAKSFTPSVSEAATPMPYFDPSAVAATDAVPPFLPHPYPHPQQLLHAGFYTNYRPPPPPPPPPTGTASPAGPYNPMPQIPIVPAGHPYGMYRGPLQPGMIHGPAHPPPPFYPGGYHGHNIIYGGGVPMHQQPSVPGGSSNGRMMEGEDGGYRGRGVGGRGMLRGGGAGRRNNARNNITKGGRSSMSPGRGGPYYPMNYSAYPVSAAVGVGPMVQHGDPQISGVAMNYYDIAAVDPVAFSDQQHPKHATQAVAPLPNESDTTHTTTFSSVSDDAVDDDAKAENEVKADQGKGTEKEG